MLRDIQTIMPGSASVESRRLTRRPSRADSRGDEGRAWCLPIFNLACILCCIKPAADENGQQTENDEDLKSEISSQSSADEFANNDQQEPNQNSYGRSSRFHF